MTIKKSTAAIHAALQPGETIVASCEATLASGGNVRGVLALTDTRVLYRAAMLGKTVQRSWPLRAVIAADLSKNLMQAFVQVQVQGDAQQFRVKYNEAVPFAEAVSNALTTV